MNESIGVLICLVFRNRLHGDQKSPMAEESERHVGSPFLMRLFPVVDFGKSAIKVAIPAERVSGIRTEPWYFFPPQGS